MENIEKIRTVSRRLKALCTALLWLTPFGLAAFWLAFNHLPADMTDLMFPAYVSRVQPFYTRGLAFLAGLLPAGAVMFALAALRGLFSLYMRGMIFTGENVRCFRRIGLALIWWAAASFVHTPLSSVIMTLVNGPGKRMLTLGIGSDEAVNLILGIMVLLVSWVMDEGRKLEEDRALTI